MTWERFKAVDEIISGEAFKKIATLMTMKPINIYKALENVSKLFSGVILDSIQLPEFKPEDFVIVDTISELIEIEERLRAVETELTLLKEQSSLISKELYEKLKRKLKELEEDVDKAYH